MPSGLDTSGRAEARSGGGLGGTLSRWFLKPDDPKGRAPSAPRKRSVEELKEDVRSADDRERLVGLIGAPVAAGIGFAVARHVHGTVASKSEMLIVALALALAMLVLAWFRKRASLGITMALYGLSIFSLGFWGFGVPFVFAAAWLLVRAYRTQRDLSEAAGTPPARSAGPAGRRSSGAVAPPASGRSRRPAGQRRSRPPSKGAARRRAR